VSPSISSTASSVCKTNSIYVTRNLICHKKKAKHTPDWARVMCTEMSKETYIDMSKETNIVKRDLHIVCFKKDLHETYAGWGESCVYRNVKRDLYGQKRPIYCVVQKKRM